MKRARALRLIATNPVEDATRPQVERQELDVLEPDEAARLLATAATTRLHAPILLALATGMRRGEILALRWSDVDLPGQSLRVVQSLEQTKGGLRFKAPKTKHRRRTIALSPSVVEVLQAHRVKQLEERLLLGLGKDEHGLVFTQITGDVSIRETSARSSPGSSDGRASARSPSTGCVVPHMSCLLQAGVHPKIASERAGHS